jgi:hypothetical protein
VARLYDDFSSANFRPWRWKWDVPPKRLLTNGLYDAVSQRMATFMSISFIVTMYTWNCRSGNHMREWYQVWSHETVWKWNLDWNGLRSSLVTCHCEHCQNSSFYESNTDQQLFAEHLASVMQLFLELFALWSCVTFRKRAVQISPARPSSLKWRITCVSPIIYSLTFVMKHKD